MSKSSGKPPIKEKTKTKSLARGLTDNADDLVIENNAEEKKKSSEIPTGAKKAEKGQGEKLFDFDLDEAPFCPCVRFKIPGNVKDSICFDIKNKLIIGSDPKQCKMVLQHPTISPVHVMFGLKGEEVVLKHFSEHGTTLKNEKLEINKTYKIPFDQKIKIGALTIEVLRSRPLDIVEVNINRSWKGGIDPNDNQGAHEFKDDTKHKQLRRRSTFFGALFDTLFGFLDPRDEVEKEEDEDESEWVTEDEWNKAPEEEKKHLKVVKEGELVDKNFKTQEQKSIEKQPFYKRPFLQFLHGLKDEFSFFDIKRQKNLEAQVEASKRVVVEKKLNHLTQNELLETKAAAKLIKNGIHSLPQLANLDEKKLSKILGVKKEEAQELLQKVSKGLESGTLEKPSKELQTLEKNVSSNEAKVNQKLNHLQTAGPVKRVFGALGNFFTIFGIYYFLTMNQQFMDWKATNLIPVLRSIFTNQIRPNLLNVGPFPDELLTLIEVSLPFISFHLGVQLVSHILFGLTPGQFFLGLRNSRSFLASRLLGLMRYLIGLITGPFIIFDLPILFRLKSLKEILTFNTLIRRSIRGIGLEVFTIIIFTCTSVTGMGTFFYFLRDSNNRSLFLLPTTTLGKTLSPYLNQINFFPEELYSIKRENIAYNWHPLKLGQVSGEFKLKAFLDKMPEKFEEGNDLYSLHWLVVEPGKKAEVKLIGDSKIEVSGPAKLLIDQLTSSKAIVVFLERGLARIMSKQNSYGFHFISKEMLVDFEEGDTFISSDNSNTVLATVLGSHHVAKIVAMDLSIFDAIQKARNILGQMVVSGKMVRTVKPGCFVLQRKGKERATAPTRYTPFQFKVWLGQEIEEGSYGCRFISSDSELPNFTELKNETAGVAANEGNQEGVSDKEYYLPPGGAIDFKAVDYVAPQVGPLVGQLSVYKFPNPERIDLTTGFLIDGDPTPDETLESK